MNHGTRRRFLQGVISTPLIGAGAAFAAAPQPQIIGPRSPVKDAIRTEVLVVGAGASGVPAALAAARSGAKVILIEEDAVPGGAPVDMFVSMICGGPVVGIYGEMMAMLDRDFDLDNKQGTIAEGRWFAPSAYVHVISRMLRAEPNVDLWCAAPATDVLISEGGRNRVRGVVVRRPGQPPRAIEADVVIDASGSAVVAALAGCECRYGTEARSEFNEPLGPKTSSDTVQLCTLMLLHQRLRSDAQIDHRQLGGSMSVPSHENNAVLHWAGTVRCSDTRDPVAIAKAHQEAIEKVETIVDYAYRCGYVAHMAPKLGVRESCRVVGDHVLSVNDLIRPERPEDTVALGSYRLDSWGDSHGGAAGRTHLDLTPGGYGIPLPTLWVRGFDNLMVVGKCLSATHLAQSAVRVQCIVAQMGQAGGIAAALAVAKQTDLRSLPVREIQTRLKATGIPL